MATNNKDQANRKKEAFKSFLETSTSPGTTDSKKNLSDHEEVCT
jgi:hypothetical protein